MITKTDLKLWKAYRKWVDKMNVGIEERNRERTNEAFKDITESGHLNRFPRITPIIEPTIAGFLDYLTKETK